MSTPGGPCPTETPLPTRKRLSSYASIANFSSAKRRRMSMIGDDIELQPEYAVNHSPVSLSVDRFVPSRPKTHIPLNVTPRTTRISQQFGLTDNRVLNFKGNQENIPTSSRDEGNMMGLLRKNASALFRSPVCKRPTSVTENLSKRQQCILTLDGPGISSDPYAYPITWSRKNLIAVACQNDIFYQNLDTRSVTHLCKVEVSTPGHLRAIEWAGKGREFSLASGSSTGVVQMWDSGQGGEGTLLRMWREEETTAVGGLDWNGDVLSVGLYDGTISHFDTRSNRAATRVKPHKGKVFGIKWNVDGQYMASSDDTGLVYIWDRRAGKELLDEAAHGSKMRHQGPVKALAWCSWKSDLLATGSIFPEGKIRIWSAASPSTPPTPLETIPLNTSVLSLHWSPHCKELLSTHGSSFEPALKPSRPSSSSNTQQRPRLRPVVSPLTNAIVVHEYPSAKRLLTVTAHFGPTTHSCLGPDGQNLFTVCPKEETIKMWNVWKKRKDGQKRESIFDKCTIR